ncbi:MAG: hypothetical protein WBB02_04115 [Saprospiraceae bacterium]|nr:hypothetical protein [Saprospiraceae bacterium]
MRTNLFFKTLHIIILTYFIAFITFLPEADAQVRKSRKKEKPPITEKLWYGGGFNLNFGSDIYSSVFTIGVSPMVGYKLNSFLSAGPRVSIDWTIAKFNDGFTAYKFNSLDYGVGAFVRAKFFHNFFAHLEYSQLNVTYSDGNVINNKLVKYREWKDILLLGLGYTSDSEISYEFYVNYNFLEDDNSFQVPILYRAGITYKF